ncbi:Intraflagellar transport complex B protein 46 [Spironucleus salmonicida]|nr:Intraflagellar transport complex B protein 46 [Spironucleus salmonicida]
MRNLRNSVSSTPSISDSISQGDQEEEIINSQKLFNSPEQLQNGCQQKYNNDISSANLQDEIQDVVQNNNINQLSEQTEGIIHHEHHISSRVNQNQTKYILQCEEQSVDLDFTQLSNDDLINMYKLFQPTEMLLETLFVPFLQEYQPSIGEVDPYIKLPRPDNSIDKIGVSVLDEPCINQSNKVVLISKLSQTQIKLYQKHQKYCEVPIVTDLSTLNDFIFQIEQLHQKSPQKYEYKHPINQQCLEMYDKTFEDDVKQILLPTAQIQLDVIQYFQVICTLLDIPYYNDSKLDSLMMLFELYYEAIGEQDAQKYL